MSQPYEPDCDWPASSECECIKEILPSRDLAIAAMTSGQNIRVFYPNNISKI